MSRLDFQALASALNPETCVREWLPDGKRNGGEWVARNPTRNDATPGSFSVNLRTGQWADFATGDKGGDIVSLYAYIRHANDNGAAARELSSRYDIEIGAAERQAAAEAARPDEPVILSPVPQGAPEATFTHPRYGDPTTIFPYFDAAGSVLIYVCRFDPPGERKQILPRSYVQEPDGRKRWAWRGFPNRAKRPLYGLDRLAAMPAVPVIVCEGEKAADAAQRIVGKRAACVSFMGGSSSADLAIVRPLKGRNVILWPDADDKTYPKSHARAGQRMDLHDQPGIRAMVEIARSIGETSDSLQMVGYAFGELEDGWDLADAEAAGWDADRVFQHIQARAGSPWRIAGDVQAAAPAPAATNDNTPAAVPMDGNVNPYAYPHLSAKGQPLNTIENLAHLLGEYGIRARYNEVRKNVEVNIPGAAFSPDNRDNCALAEVSSLCARNRMPASSIDAYVKVIAEKSRYSPVMEWIRSKPWDGKSRLRDLLETVQTTSDANLKDVLIYRWLISAVSAAAKPSGFSSHGVLVFTGSQGLGKTSWFRKLVPQELGLTLDGALLDPSNKDHVLNAVSHWLVELGELDATFRKADIARLKSFVTCSTDKLRRPYDRRESEYPRRTVFFASVNEDKYLVDDTGNRRWWTVPVSSVNYDHTIDMQQLWAEVLREFEGGEQHWLKPDELDALNGANADHATLDPIEELILGTYEWEEKLFRTQVRTATDVLIEIGFKNPTRAQTTTASKVLQRLTEKPPRKSHGRLVFDIPSKRIPQ